jgi:hypothetical protein
MFTFHCVDMYINGEMIANCEYQISNILFVTKLEIKEKFRGNGYGSALLYEIFTDVSRLGAINDVELLDSTKIKGDNNIYRKLGLNYASNMFHMYGSLKEILHYNYYGKMKHKIFKKQGDTHKTKSVCRYFFP